MKRIALVGLLALTACDGPHPMANKDIIAEVDRCKRAGMKAQQLYAPMSNSGASIVAIQCTQ